MVGKQEVTLAGTCLAVGGAITYVLAVIHYLKVGHIQILTRSYNLPDRSKGIGSDSGEHSAGIGYVEGLCDQQSFKQRDEAEKLTKQMKRG